MPEPDLVHPTGGEGVTTSDICWTGVDARRRRSESSRARFDIAPARSLRFGRGDTGAGLRLSCGVCGHPTDCGLVHVQ
jgi:hypothetical protein